VRRAHQVVDVVVAPDADTADTVGTSSGGGPGVNVRTLRMLRRQEITNVSPANVATCANFDVDDGASPLTVITCSAGKRTSSR
jgi:hypothetical protein